MSEYSVEEVRARFEAWAAFHTCLSFNRDSSGNYDERQTRTAWLAYDAAYADLREQIERAREGVRTALLKSIGGYLERHHSDNAISYDAIADHAIQSVAHLLPSGERGGVDEGMVRRGAEGAWNMVERGCAFDHATTFLQKEWESIARAVLTAAQAQPAQVAGVDAGDIRTTVDAAWRAAGVGAAEQASEWFSREFRDLHPATASLVWNFALALGNKLSDAERKYGYTDGWRSPDWMDECRHHLMQHIAKGDPRDVAAYCAFLWHHGASTAPTADPVAKVDQVNELLAVIHGDGGHYVAEHGTQKTAKDALAKVIEMMTNLAAAEKDPVAQGDANIPTERDDLVFQLIEVTEERDHLLAALAAQPASPEQPAGRQGEAAALPMGSAPRDGTMLRLLVRFTEHATEDAEGVEPLVIRLGEVTDKLERANALLREAIGWNWLDDDAPRPDVMDVLDQAIQSHLLGAADEA